MSGRAAKEVLALMAGGDGRDAADIVRARGLQQLSGTEELSTLCDEVLAAHADKAAAYRKGKAGLLGFFVAQVMARTGGRANPRATSALLARKLAA